MNCDFVVPCVMRIMCARLSNQFKKTKNKNQNNPKISRQTGTHNYAVR